MTFAQPEWLIALAAVPALALVAWRAWRRRGTRWKRLVAARLETRLTRTRPTWVHFVALGLALAGWSGLVIAMAEPESGEEWIEIENEGRNLLFCIDISRSMLSEDVSPSRLQASRAAALEILEKFPNDRVGIILFAGAPGVQSPLALDHTHVEQTLSQLDPEDIPYGGSNLAGAVKEGTQLLQETGQQNNIMVILSDGERSSEGLAEAGEEAREAGVFIYALGMGTPDGSFIPDPRERDGRFRDRSGNVVLTQLDEQALKLLAEDTGGYYSRGMGGGFLDRLSIALAEMDRFREDGKFQRVAKPAHQWFALGGIFLLMTSLVIRCLPLRPALAATAIILAVPRAQAGAIEDGIAALAVGEPAEAHFHFRRAAREAGPSQAPRLHLSAGSAAAKAQDWPAAIDAFSEALASDNATLQQQAHYGLATALFYHGAPLEKKDRITNWRGAVNHFEAAVQLDPKDLRARENLAQVKKYLKELEEKAPPPPPKQDQQQDDQESEQKEQDEPEKQDGDKKEQKDPKRNPEPPEDEPKPGEKPPPQEDRKSEEEKPGNEKKSQNGEDQEKPGQDEENESGEQPEGRQPKPGETRKGENDQKEGQGELLEDPDAPPNETAEERARRWIKQYADFGAKAPRRMRRPFNRRAHDW